jgi:hypothetical protein
MILETSHGNADEATPDLIREIMQDDSRRGEFVILSESDKGYLQASGEAGHFHVEYREGGDETHSYARRDLTRRELEALMLRYLRQQPDWKDGHERLPLSEIQPDSRLTWDIAW